MTIAQAFNEIAVAQGGTPNYSGTISGAIDALNDALAGSDQPAAQTIEGAVRLLGQHIGGGGGGGSMTLYISQDGALPEGVLFYVDPVTGTATEIVPEGEEDFFGGEISTYVYEVPSGVFSTIFAAPAAAQYVFEVYNMAFVAETLEGLQDQDGVGFCLSGGDRYVKIPTIAGHVIASLETNNIH